MTPFEKIFTDQTQVACDGGNDAQAMSSGGHPRVYLHMDRDSGSVVCPYCSRTYILHSGPVTALREERV